MGTRGLYGIRKNGIDKATYNHWDSYPDYLGKSVVEFCNGNGIEGLHKFFDSIELVDERSSPSKEQIERCVAAGYADTTVSNRTTADWYCLIRNLQGNFPEYQKLIDNDMKVYMADKISFIRDSLFCEYAYIINLDDNVLEFYTGFQRVPQEGNRYGTDVAYEGYDGNYYPCKLLKTFPLNELDDVEAIVDAMNMAAEEEYGS